MNSLVSGLAVAIILTLALLAGFYANSDSDAVTSEQNITVATCASLPDYDYERMRSRVERIKGMQLRRFLSMCVEGTRDGIDTTRTAT